VKEVTAGSFNIHPKSPFIITVTLFIQLHLGGGHGVVEPRRLRLVAGLSVFIGKVFGSNLRQFPQPIHSNSHSSSYFFFFLLLIIKFGLRNLHYLGNVLITSSNRLL
jgi:hypothetical protein